MLFKTFLLVLLIKFSICCSTKYSIAYEYLKNSNELKNQLSEFFKGKDSTRRPPEVSKDIVYLDCSPYFPPNSDTALHLNSDENSSTRYYQKHYFQAYTEEGITQSIQNNRSFATSNLQLFFSKPVNNFLIAVVYDKRYLFKIESKTDKTFKYVYNGKAMKIIFVFNSQNQVIKFLTSKAIM